MSPLALALVLLWLQLARGDSAWAPLEGLPLACAHPCRHSRAVALWLEPGLPPARTDRYYVHVDTHIPANSVMNVTFDSRVDVTFTLRSDRWKYSRVSLTNGDGFTFGIDKDLSGLGFIVEGSSPGLTPHLTGLSINDKEFCEKPDVEYLRHYEADDTKLEDDEYKLNAVIRRSKIGSNNCGKSKVNLNTGFENGPAQRGAWPWHVGVYRLRNYPNVGMFYVCGGTLVSQNFVLTAAHCVAVKGRALSPNRMFVELGKHNLYEIEKQSEHKKIESILLHEKFNYTNYDSDIALLKLSSAATFSEHIQPACLWPLGAYSALEDDNTVGVMVGWGYDNDNRQASELQQVQLPIVSLVTCFRSYPKYFPHFVHENSSFCAGYHNKGTGVCNGDSGGALMVFLPEKDQANGNKTSGSWHVRGVQSNSLAVVGSPVCDPDQYSVFIDMNNFRDWMEHGHLEG
ncbi:plasminogen isoform X1 [Bicyclus anynana]|uniref:Plasminogen isoform X1 n=1 Tax=Bicyclus anynana TaxID=110368 RepID=A0A6J1N3Z1_BICAN|nr:plasminogen isoform X1 [Bicyclus anynana]XP_052744701.1 plasminogen isoform X1 [Bicyclus anynana]